MVRGFKSNMASRHSSARLGQKHYCETCNCYVQPDAASVRSHEAGSRHKNNARNRAFLRARDEREALRDQSELQRTLREMEQAAQAAVRRDAIGPVAAAAEAGGAPPPEPPPPELEGIVG